MADKLEERLLPCPFCGGQAEWRWHSSPECWIECSKCGAIGPSDVNTTSDQNFAAWNARTPEAADEITRLNAENERVRALVDEMREGLDSIGSGEAFRQLRFAEDDDTDYFLRCQREVQKLARALTKASRDSGHG